MALLLEQRTLPRERAYAEECMRRRGRRPWRGRLKPTCRRALESGWAAYDAGAFALSEGRFARAVEIDAGCALAFAWRGEARLQASYFGPRVSASWWRSARRKYPKPSFWVWDTYPQEPEGLGLLDDFEQAILLDPDCDWYVLKRGEIRYNLVHHHRYLADLRLAAKLNPLSAWNHAWLGDFYSQTKDPERGLRECKEALRLNPNAAWIHAILGKVQAFVPALREEAAASFNRALSLEPDSGWIYSWRGEVRRLQGRWAQTESDCSRALELDPGYYFAYVWRGGARRRLGKYEAAMTDLDEAARLGPHYPWTYSWRSLLRRDRGDWDGALRDMARACSLRPAFTWIFEESGRPGTAAAAEAALERILERNPRCAPARAWRGEARFKVGRFAEALDDLDAALQDGGDAAPWARLWRGKTLLALGCPEAALDDLASSQKRYARYSDPSLWLAQAYFQLGADEEALVQVERCLEIDPLAARGRLLRAVLRGRRGDLQGQAEDYRSVLRFSPEFFKDKRAAAETGLAQLEGAWA